MPIVLIFAGLMVDVHGSGYLGKYLASDSVYNMDASVEAYCDLFKFGPVTFFIDYKNDLDMARQEGNISLDPRHVHYYLTPGFTYQADDLILSGYVVHDCIHDIDVENPGTPVFNRFRLAIEPKDFHIRNRADSIMTNPLWRLMIGAYPQFKFYDWTNWGADYKYELKVDLITPILTRGPACLAVGIDSHIIKREERGFYQIHLLRCNLEVAGKHGLVIPFINYYLYNNDPLKNPSRVGILGIEVVF